jgi:hypothetical protein
LQINGIEIPKRISKLPRDHRGYPVPFFVDYDKEGNPDFRVMDYRKLRRAVLDKLCFICGEKLGKFMAFTVGPMCAVNRVSAEPPSHLQCSIFAATVCPFLTNPDQKRNERAVKGYEKGDTAEPEGMIRRNPGVAMTWVCTNYRIYSTKTGPLFRFEDDPTDVMFWCKGRPAVLEEIMESVVSGLPLLYDECAKEKDPDLAMKELMEAEKKAMVLFHKYGSKVKAVAGAGSEA